MAGWVRTQAALAENLTPVPSTQVRLVTIDCNSSCRGSDAQCGHCPHTHTTTCKHIHDWKEITV